MRLFVLFTPQSSEARLNRLPKHLLLQHHVFVDADNAFQQRARLLQALWRERNGLPMGERRPGSALGSRLPMPFARETAANLITEAARAAARAAVAEMRAGSGQKIEEDRLWANLLSSQPMAFNLFADLGSDLNAATRVMRRLWPERVARVSSIRFEYSPGRRNATYTADKTAFDVYVEAVTPRGGRSFLGIEVKYHEALKDEEAEHRPRYDEVTAAMGCFRPEFADTLRKRPIEQIWRDHMLAGSMLLDSSVGWETGLYVFLFPKSNDACHLAVDLYSRCLAETGTFQAMTLETVADAIADEVGGPAIKAFTDRYLSWETIDEVIRSGLPNGAEGGLGSG